MLCAFPFSLALSLYIPISSFSFRLTLRLRAIADGSLICVWRSYCAGLMTEPPEELIAPGAFPFVLFVCFAEPCVLADLMKVDEFYLHVFCSVSVVRFVRPCDIATRVCGFHCILFFIHATQSFMRAREHIPTQVNESYLHLFCSVSVVRFVRACNIATPVCGFHCILFVIHTT